LAPEAQAAAVPPRPALAPEAASNPVDAADAEFGHGDRRAEALREAERVLAAPSPHLVLGGGNTEETRREFRRLVLLLHPDRGHCSGERAALALRRVVEAHQVLHAGADCATQPSQRTARSEAL